MKAGEHFTVDEQEYEVVRFDYFRCKNCERVTLTGLCGCPNRDSEKCDEVLVGMPVMA